MLQVKQALAERSSMRVHVQQLFLRDDARSESMDLELRDEETIAQVRKHGMGAASKKSDVKLASVCMFVVHANLS